jgi:hypothetical protein
MSPRDLFNIILKTLGILLIKDILIALPATLGMLVDLGELESDALFIAILPLLYLILYCFIIFLLIFRSGWIIDKLRLTDGFSSTDLSINFNRRAILSIAVIFTSLLIIVQALPQLVRELVAWVDYRRSSNRFLRMEGSFDYLWMVANAVEIAIGLTILYYQHSIVDFIIQKSRQPELQTEDTVDDHS